MILLIILLWIRYVSIELISEKSLRYVITGTYTIIIKTSVKKNEQTSFYNYEYDTLNLIYELPIILIVVILVTTGFDLSERNLIVESY